MVVICHLREMLKKGETRTEVNFFPGESLNPDCTASSFSKVCLLKLCKMFFPILCCLTFVLRYMQRDDCCIQLTAAASGYCTRDKTQETDTGGNDADL